MKIKKTKLVLSILLVSTFLSVPVFAKEIASKVFYIQSAMEYGKTWKGCWDVPGNPGSFRKGQNIKVWVITQQDQNSSDRKFQFRHIRDDIYEINSRLFPTARHRVDIAGGGNRNGTNIQLWEKNNSSAQRFRMKYVGNGRWKIYTLRGKILCLDGRSSKNGTNVHLWDDHNGPWCEWVLVTAGRVHRAYVPPRKEKKYKLNITLQQAVRSGAIQIDAYFRNVDFHTYMTEKRIKSLPCILNSMKDVDMLTSFQNIINSVSRNNKSDVKSNVYRDLLKVDYSKMDKSFILRLAKNKIKSNIKKTLKKEKDRLSRIYLKRIVDKLK